MTLILNIFDLINDLRIQVLINYFLVVSWFLYATGVPVDESVEYGLTAMFTAGFAYLLNRYTDYPYDLIADKGLKKFPRSVYLYCSLFFLFLIGILFLNGIFYPLPIFLGAFLGVLYSVKTIFKYPLKNYFIVKNFFAAGSKYLITLLGALTLAQVSWLLFFRSISMFAFHLIYEILWDIRDIKADAHGNVSTIPRKVGKDQTLFLCLLICVTSFVSQFFFVKITDHFFLKYAVVLLFITSLFLVRHPRWFHVMIYVHLVINLLFINDEVLIYLAEKITYFGFL